MYFYVNISTFEGMPSINFKKIAQHLSKLISIPTKQYMIDIVLKH
jgi:hypothetical protein